MAKLVSWIAMVVVGALVVLFSISNQSLIVLELWPFPYSIQVQMYTAVLAAAISGFIGGVVITWFSVGSLRRKARFAFRRADGLEKDLEKLREKIEELEESRKSLG